MRPEADDPPAVEVHPGAVMWAELEPVRGREQSGRRPVLVVAAPGYLQAVATLVICVPITSVDRGWPNHIPLTGPTGLARTSWAMTEQPRTLSRERLVSTAGDVDESCLVATRRWLADFLDLPTPS